MTFDDEDSDMKLSSPTCPQLALQLHDATMRLALLAGYLRDRSLYRAGFLVSAAHSAALLNQDVSLQRLSHAIMRADAALAADETARRFAEVFPPPSGSTDAETITESSS